MEKKSELKIAKSDIIEFIKMKNIVFIFIIVIFLIAVWTFSKNNVLNSINKVYIEYERITSIHTDYEKETIEICIAPESFFGGTIKETKFKLQQIYDSDMIAFDNSVSSPYMGEDSVLYIPDTYPR